MKHYKDDCHHYKVLDDHRFVSVLNLGRFETSIKFENYGDIKHYLSSSIARGKVKPCTESEYQTAFDKALKTINNLKN